MNSKKQMVRKITAIVSSICFLASNNLNTIGIISAELSDNKVVSDRETAVVSDSTRTQIKTPSVTGITTVKAPSVTSAEATKAPVVTDVTTKAPSVTSAEATKVPGVTTKAPAVTSVTTSKAPSAITTGVTSVTTGSEPSVTTAGVTTTADVTTTVSEVTTTVTSSRQKYREEITINDTSLSYENKKDVFNNIKNALDAKKSEAGLSFNTNILEHQKEVRLFFSYMAYPDEAENLKKSIFELFSGLDIEDKVYNNKYYDFSVDKSNFTVNTVRYFKLNDNTHDIVKYGISEDMLKNKDNAVYIKEGTILTESSFVPENGYYIEASHDDIKFTVHNEVTIGYDQGKIKIYYANDKNTYLELKKSVLDLEFSINGAEVMYNYKSVKELNLEWLELNKENLKIVLGDNDTAVSINGNIKNCGKEWTVSAAELLGYAGELSDSTEYKHNEKITVTINAIPKQVKAGVRIDDEVSRDGLTLLIDEKSQLKIPYILQRGDETYYLKKSVYKYNDQSEYNEEEYTFAQIYDELAGGLNKTVAYEYKVSDKYNPSKWYHSVIDSVELEYTKISDNILAEKANESIRKCVSGSDDISGMRSDDVFSASYKSIIYIKIAEEFENTAMLFANNKGETTSLIVQNGMIDLFIPNDQISFYKALLLVDMSDPKNPIPLPFTPFTLYLDDHSPDVQITKTLQSYETSDGEIQTSEWSRDENFVFEFSVNDTETEFGDVAHELKDVPDEINSDSSLNSVSVLNIGGYTFKRPELGWDKASVIYPDKPEITEGEEADTKDYTITLTPEAEYGAFNGKFKAVLTLENKAIRGFDETITVEAVDSCGNKSNQGSVNVKIDTGVPKVTKFEITKGLAEGRVDIIARSANIECKSEYTDEYSSANGTVQPCSGIASVTYYFDQKNNDEGKFDVNGKNVKGIIVIKATDNAGNTVNYYYCAEAEGNVTRNISAATTVVVDNEAPMLPEITHANPKYVDKDKKWYSSYPQVTFNAYDSGTIKSEIKYINITVNGVEEKIETSSIYTASADDTEVFDIVSELKSENFYIAFAPDKTDNTTFTVYLRHKEISRINIPVFKEPLKLDSSGRLNIRISTTDYAGNQSEGNGKNYSERTFYIDNNRPSVDGVFETDDSSVNVRAAGTFANHQFEIKVPISDSKGNIPSSGYKHAYIIPDDMSRIYSSRIEDGYAYFTIPEKQIKDNSSVSMTLGISVSDNVGNVSDYEVTLQSPEKQDEIIIENIKPFITASPDIAGEDRYEKKVDGKTELWFSSDVSVTYDVSDEHSGIANAELKCTAENGSSDRVEKNYTEDSKKTTEDIYSLSTVSKFEELDGKFEFTMSVNDNANNSDVKTYEVYKDIKAPYISSISFEKVQDGRLNDPDESGKIFNHFYKNSVIMTVKAQDDLGASSGMCNITCELYNTDGTLYKSFVCEEFRTENGVYSVDVAVDEGFKGDIKVWAVDNVGRKSEEKYSDGYISENEERHASSSDIKFGIPETEHSDPEGHPLYNTDVPVKIELSDTYSGISKIEWITSDMGEWASIDINENGDIRNGSDVWRVEDKERNIATVVSGNITVTNDANADSVKVKITDNSGNTVDKEIFFSIDKKAPDIQVSGIEASQDIKYYNSHKEVTVAIAERNFAAPKINDTVDTSFAEDPSSPKNTHDHRHFKKISFDSDGKYSLDISAEDLAGNKAASYSSGQFVIDTVAPKPSVQIRKENGDVVNLSENSYIDSAVSVNISVEEINFEPGSMSVTINGQAYTGSSWSGENTRSFYIPVTVFSEDGRYNIAVSGKDLAGNEMQAYSASFVIDQNLPSINISGVSAANKNDVVPVVEISDKNLKTHEIKLYRNGTECESGSSDGKISFKLPDADKYITAVMTTDQTEDGIVKKLVFDNFPTEEIYDGSYSLEVTAGDKALNTNSADMEFSVNRKGSVFAIKDIDKINNQYLNIAPSVVITERNVDKHKPDADVVIIVDKGSNTVQLTPDQYSVSEPEALDDKSGYEYEYTIFAENFDQDLDYNISVQSVDEAGNVNVSSNRGAEIGFVMDTHAPDYKCDDLIENTEYKGSDREFRLNVNEKIKLIRVSTSRGETLLEQENTGEDNSFTFVVPASNLSRDLEIELIDLAGNITVKTISNLLVTENVVLYMAHKTWVKVTAIASILGLASAGGIMYGLKKRRERN